MDTNYIRSLIITNFTILVVSLLLKTMKKYKLQIVVFVLLVLSINNYSYAYIDPGTGSYLIQMVIAVFASISVFFIKPISERIKDTDLYKKYFKKDHDTPKTDERAK